MKKQRNAFISYVLFYGGFLQMFISIAFVTIYVFALNNRKITFITWIIILTSIVSIFSIKLAGYFNLYLYVIIPYKSNLLDLKSVKQLRFDKNRGFIQGVPNNNLSEFVIPKIINSTLIELYKNDGIYIGQYNTKTIKIDMKGWILKDRYIYEFLHTYYRGCYIKSKKIPLKYIYKTIKNENIKECVLLIKNEKKTKKYNLSFNGKIKSKFFLTYKNHNKYRFMPYNKFYIQDFY